jgi:hypothetical protein
LLEGARSGQEPWKSGKSSDNPTKSCPLAPHLIQGFILLGPAEVRHGGRPVRFRARKALALLAYLAAEGGRRHRGEIIELLWPGSDEAHGRAALRSALSSLRKAFEESAEPSEKPHLLTDGDSVGLATGAAVEVSRDNRAVCEPGVGRRLGSGASLCPKGDGDQGCGADEVNVHGLHPPLRDGGAAKE